MTELLFLALLLSLFGQAPSEQELLDAAYRIDLSTVDVVLEVDPAEERVRGRARLVFRLRPGQERALLHFAPKGALDGKAALRGLRLDGEDLRPEDVRALAAPIHGFVIRRDLDGEREHVVEVEWELDEAFDRRRRGWFLCDVDDTVGRGNEILWPTINSPGELARHRIQVRVRHPKPYLVLGSGRVERQDDEEGVQVFVLDTEQEVASYTVMIAALPANDVLLESFDVGGVPVTLASAVGPAHTRRARGILRRTLPLLIEDFGPFPTPQLSVLLLDWPGEGMEYYGATITDVSALEHELAHMYWGSSAVARTWRDSWFDEALAVWWTERDSLEPLGPRFRSRMVSGRSPTDAGFDLRAYEAGARIFASIARDLGGDDELIAFLRDLHGRRALAPFTTRELIEDLVATLAPARAEGLRARLETWLYTPKGELRRGR